MRKKYEQNAVIHKLGEYFTKKGKYLELDEYNSEKDKPMRAQMVKKFSTHGVE